MIDCPTTTATATHIPIATAGLSLDTISLVTAIRQLLDITTHHHSYHNYCYYCRYHAIA